MAISQTLIDEIKIEAGKSKKMLGTIPRQHFGWKPHPKSTAMGRLASHVTELTGWVAKILEKDTLDFAKGDYVPYFASTPSELLASLDANVSVAIKALEKADDSEFRKLWTLRSGEKIIAELTKLQAIRFSALSHVVHHRAQLSVYLRLLNIPVPGMYGPSADES